MKKVIITGAYGFLGRNTALKFKKNGYKVFACGHGKWNKLEYEAWGIDEWIETSISTEALKKFNVVPDIIVHCAGSGSVGLSISEPALDFNKTVVATLSILEYMRLYAPKSRLVYPSSAAVYGEHSDTPIKVTDSLNPVSPYGVHKKIVEDLCNSYYVHFNLNISIIRFFSIYGEGLKKQLLWDACCKLSLSKNEVEFWGTGEETRDWLYITDATELLFASSLTDKQYVVVNGGTGFKTTIGNTLYKLSNNLHLENVVIGFNNIVREGDPRFYHANMDSTSQLDWYPEIDFSDGLKKYTKWFMETQHD